MKSAETCPNSQDQKLVKVVVGRDQLNQTQVLKIAKLKDPVLFDKLESGLREFWRDVPKFLEELSPMDTDMVSVLEADKDCRYESDGGYNQYSFPRNPYIQLVPKGKRFILDSCNSEDYPDDECLTLLDDLKIFKA